MSYPCCICGKVGLYHVSNRNYCGEHKAEAWADRKKFSDAMARGWKPKHNFNRAEETLKHVWQVSRERSKK